MKNHRQYSFLDKLCLGLDQAVRALTDNVQTTAKSYPAKEVEENNLTDAETKHSAALMRVNHAGEICAQALYHGQSVVSRDDTVREKMQQAALEEGDHLAWCRRRLDELNSHTSFLNPVWYIGSFCIGMVAGAIGDQWSLGFVAETERQVVRHLEGHLTLLPKKDERSQQILQQMEKDEAQHREEAIAAGAHELPLPVRQLMGLTAKIMVKTSYWV